MQKEVYELMNAKLDVLLKKCDSISATLGLPTTESCDAFKVNTNKKQDFIIEKAAKIIISEKKLSTSNRNRPPENVQQNVPSKSSSKEYSQRNVSRNINKEDQATIDESSFILF